MLLKKQVERRRCTRGFFQLAKLAFDQVDAGIARIRTHKEVPRVAGTKIGGKLEPSERKDPPQPATDKDGFELASYRANGRQIHTQSLRGQKKKSKDARVRGLFGGKQKAILVLADQDRPREDIVGGTTFLVKEHGQEA